MALIVGLGGNPSVLVGIRSFLALLEAVFVAVTAMVVSFVGDRSYFCQSLGNKDGGSGLYGGIICVRKIERIGKISISFVQN